MNSTNIEKGSSSGVIGLTREHSRSFGNEPHLPSDNNMHFVSRKENGSLHEYEDHIIPGYDANLMRARASFSSAEETRLLRRIDWHLIPLLAIIYMVKSVDFTNVCGLLYPVSLLLTRQG